MVQGKIWQAAFVLEGWRLEVGSWKLDKDLVDIMMEV